ncbi:hypothetical protein SLNSH_17230 [Alsobacter soli]|uniref:HTH luxR-type domain-containing protein n=1 Tax=Alsobacter soli TaxID=2109933 RepID=A0A2T1HPW9_9HYPH|nr:hypothetical protein SLNSH_17230 [Alsobacter soli]
MSSAIAMNWGPTDVDVLVIERRKILRDHLVQAVEEARLARSVQSFPKPEEAIVAAPAAPDGKPLILLNSDQSGDGVAAEIGALRRAYGDHALIIALCRESDAEAFAAAVAAGAPAVAPDHIGLDVLVSVMRLVLAGGTYAPSTALVALASQPASPAWGALALAPSPAGAPADIIPTLTRRQRDVLEALCRGKPNKVIAHELNLCESTVKVHLRSIMRMTRARSRTHLVAMLGSQLAAIPRTR